MRRKDMKRAAKELLRGRWFRPFFIGLLFLILCLPAAVFNGAATALGEYAELGSYNGIVIEQLTQMGTQTLMNYASICSVIGIVLYYLLDTHANVAIARYFIRYGEQRANIFTFIGGFLRRYIRTMWVYFLCGLKILLFTLLLIIPGLVKALELAIVPYVLADNPKMKTREVFEEAHLLMKGCKWKLLCLEISFLGWWLLCIITCGLAVPFFMPYYQATMAQFYRCAKQRYEAA